VITTMKMPHRNLQAVPSRAMPPVVPGGQLARAHATAEPGWSEPGALRGSGYAARGSFRDGARPAPLTPTVYIVDDDAEMRETLRSLVSSVNLPVETYASGQEFLETQSGGRAGCLVVGLRMPGLSGIDLQDELVSRGLTLPVIIISGYGDVPTAARAMRAGALDFLEKPVSRQLLLDRVREGLEVDRQRRLADAERTEIGGRVARLTPRERQVMELVVSGNSNKVIAMDLGLCEKTVEVHRAHVMEKMQARSLAELVRLAMQVLPSGSIPSPVRS